MKLTDLLLPVVATNVRSAYYATDYPFGFKLRCIQRTFIQRADTGSKAGQQRIVVQTTKKHFNADYTKANKEDRQSLFEQAKLNDHLWNAPKYSTYSNCILLFVNCQNTHLQHLHFSMYNDPSYFEAARVLPLNNEQLKLLNETERFCRNLSPSSWQKWDVEEVENRNLETRAAARKILAACGLEEEDINNFLVPALFDKMLLEEHAKKFTE